MNATAHFLARTQQRCISAAMVELIFDLGSSNCKGDLVLLGTKELDRAISKLSQLRGDLERMRSNGGAGVAYDGDTLITTFHRYKKFKRN